MSRRIPASDREALAAELRGCRSSPSTNSGNAGDDLRIGAFPRDRPFLLTRSIIYRLQERGYGGLKPSTTRLLGKAVEEIATGPSNKPQTRMAQSGIPTPAWSVVLGQAHGISGCTVFCDRCWALASLWPTTARSARRITLRSARCERAAIHRLQRLTAVLGQEGAPQSSYRLRFDANSTVSSTVLTRAAVARKSGAHHMRPPRLLSPSRWLRLPLECWCGTNPSLVPDIGPRAIRHRGPRRISPARPADCCKLSLAPLLAQC
jgi:hypothetical protein